MNIFSWNPKRKTYAFGLLPLPLYSRTNNFGDLLGPLIVEWILKKNRLQNTKHTPRTLFTVGSVIHFASTNDVIWGSGINGKIPSDAYKFVSLQCKSVRGPLTKKFLQSEFSLQVPDIFGDPALIVPQIFPKHSLVNKPTPDPIFIPNLNDADQLKAEYCQDIKRISPRSPLKYILSKIVNAPAVYASSLHGFILAEAYQVPCFLIKSRHEPAFKYLDYYHGTGREGLRIYESLKHASKHSPSPPLRFNCDRLLSSFPYELFTRKP